MCQVWVFMSGNYSNLPLYTTSKINFDADLAILSLPRPSSLYYITKRTKVQVKVIYSNPFSLSPLLPLPPFLLFILALIIVLIMYFGQIFILIWCVTETASSAISSPKDQLQHQLQSWTNLRNKQLALR